MKKSGIFAKVFIYTIIFSMLLVGAATVLLLQQLQTYRTHLRIQSVVNSYTDMGDLPKPKGDVLEKARLFDDAQSFPFYITDQNGQVVYKTRDADRSGIFVGMPPDVARTTIIIRLDRNYNLYALKSDVFAGDYGKWAAQAMLISGAMLAACLIGAFFFARRMTKPIKALADHATRMANLEEVPPPPLRKDELGALARDVYSMYDKLKQTISELEAEILRERELEEGQRYFFSAASHELKTPIAATSVLLEGMIENVGDYKDHPKYLRECVKLMDAQSAIISELLAIVSLSDGKIVPAIERVEVSRMVSGILPGFQALAEAGGQRIVVEIPGGQTCLADPKMLGKALSNVLLNAVQNTPGGGEIWIWSEPGGGRGGYRLCVRNTGARIDDAVLSKLFDPFYRVDQARSRKGERSGLGLTIVRKTLEAMNIPFALENTPDGVLFWMDLPGGEAEQS